MWLEDGTATLERSLWPWHSTYSNCAKRQPRGTCSSNALTQVFEDTHSNLTLKFPFIGHDWWLGWCLHAFFGCRKQRQKYFLYIYQFILTQTVYYKHLCACYFSVCSPWTVKIIHDVRMPKKLVKKIKQELQWKIREQDWLGTRTKTCGGPCLPQSAGSHCPEVTLGDTLNPC